MNNYLLILQEKNFYLFFFTELQFFKEKVFFPLFGKFFPFFINILHILIIS